MSMEKSEKKYRNERSEKSQKSQRSQRKDYSQKKEEIKFIIPDSMKIENIPKEELSAFEEGTDFVFLMQKYRNERSEKSQKSQRSQRKDYSQKKEEIKFIIPDSMKIENIPKEETTKKETTKKDNKKETTKKKRRHS